MRRITALSAAILTALSLNAQAINLSDVYQDALENDYQLKIAQAELNATLEGEEEAWAGVRPAVTAGGSLMRHELDGSDTSSYNSTGLSVGVTQTLFDTSSYNSTGLSVGVTQTLFNSVKFQQIGVAEASSAQARFSFREAEMDLMVRVTEAFFEVLKAKDSLTSSQAQEKAIKRQLEQAQQQFKVGLIPITGVNEAQAAYDASRATRIGAEGALLISEESLQLLTGKSYDQMHGLVDSFPVTDPQPSSVQHWIDLALSNSPAVKAAQEQKDVARLGVDVAQAAFLPYVDAKAQLAYSDTSTSSAATDLSFGVEMGWQIYTGGATSANIRRLGHFLNQSEQSLELQKRSTALNTRTQYIQVTTSVEQVEARRQALISSESALKATRSGYEVGTRNIVDVLQAEQAFFTAETAYLDTRYDYLISLIKLKQATGTLKPEDISDLDQWLQ